MRTLLDDDDYSNRFYQDSSVDVSTFVTDYEFRQSLDNDIFDSYVEEDEYDDLLDEEEE